MTVNTNSRYGHIAVVLHWLVAALVICNVFLAWSFDYWPDKYAMTAGNTHKSIGITVFGLAIMRLLWRTTHQPPALLPELRHWEATAARIAHASLYVLIFAMPLSGWLYDSAWKDGPANPIHFFGLLDFPRLPYIVDQAPQAKEKLDALFGSMHHWLAYLLYGLVLLHVAGALKHQFIDKQPELRRMMLPRTAAPSAAPPHDLPR